MAGRNQHYFWQVLQRGFGTERKPNYFLVYAYRKDREPFEVGTKNIGAERDFFDFSPGSGADQLVTESENEIQGLIKHFQSGGEIYEEHVEPISVLIAHLESRTKFLRQNLGEVAMDLMEEMNRWFSDSKTFKRMMTRHLESERDTLEDSLINDIPDKSLRAALIDVAVNHFDLLGSDVIKAASNESAIFIEQLVSNMAQVAKDAHIKSLIKTSMAAERRNRYLNLKYRIKSGFHGNLICADTMVVFLTKQRPKPFLDRNDKIDEVWIPLTPELMLVGERHGKSERTNESVLRILASTSFETFIARSNTPGLRKLTSLIGKNAKLLSHHELQSMKREILSGLT